MKVIPLYCVSGLLRGCSVRCLSFFYGGESSFINALFESISQTQLFILMYLGLVFIGIELNLCSGMDLKSGVSAAIAWYGSYAGRAS